MKLLEPKNDLCCKQDIDIKPDLNKLPNFEGFSYLTEINSQFSIRSCGSLRLAYQMSRLRQVEIDVDLLDQGRMLKGPGLILLVLHIYKCSQAFMVSHSDQG